MLGDVGDPLAVRLTRSDVLADVVVVSGRSRLLAVASPAHGRGPQLLLDTPPQGAAISDVDARTLEFVRQEPVAKRWIIGLGVD